MFSERELVDLSDPKLDKLLDEVDQLPEAGNSLLSKITEDLKPRYRWDPLAALSFIGGVSVLLVAGTYLYLNN